MSRHEAEGLGDRRGCRQSDRRGCHHVPHYGGFRVAFAEYDAKREIALGKSAQQGVLLNDKECVDLSVLHQFDGAHHGGVGSDRDSRNPCSFENAHVVASPNPTPFSPDIL
jgi:hypothetical protein